MQYANSHAATYMPFANWREPPLVAAASVALHHMTSNQVRSGAIQNATRPAKSQPHVSHKLAPTRSSAGVQVILYHTCIGQRCHSVWAAVTHVSLAIRASGFAPNFQPRSPCGNGEVGVCHASKCDRGYSTAACSGMRRYVRLPDLLPLFA